MSQRALIILHPGFEEMEAVAPIDLLSRAQVELVQASSSDALQVEGRSGIRWEATHTFTEITSEIFDAVIIPDGPGIMELRGDARIVECLQRHHRSGQLIACICAAPLLLLDVDLIKGTTYTAHPSSAKELNHACEDSVAVDGNIISSREADAATGFALAIVHFLCGKERRKEIAAAINDPHNC
jgi:4-methyl-5(b-hydroxyethyl)-thiazole monophosphate biosynthesis